MSATGALIPFPNVRRPMVEWQGFYSTTQISRLSGIPRRTLYDWKARGVVSPSVRVIDAGLVIDEGYSYADLAIIKLMRGLRNRQLNLRSVARTLRHLYDRFGPPIGQRWEGTHVFVVNKEVFAVRPDEWDTTVGTLYGQRAEMRVFGELVEEEAAILIPKDFTAYVEINPNVMAGQPVIRNTRILTSTIATLSEEGVSLQELGKLYAPTPEPALEKAIAFEQALDKALISPTPTTTATTAPTR